MNNCGHTVDQDRSMLMCFQAHAEEAIQKALWLVRMPPVDIRPAPFVIVTRLTGCQLYQVYPKLPRTEAFSLMNLLHQAGPA